MCPKLLCHYNVKYPNLYPFFTEDWPIFLCFWCFQESSVCIIPDFYRTFKKRRPIKIYICILFKYPLIKLSFVRWFIPMYFSPWMRFASIMRVTHIIIKNYLNQFTSILSLNVPSVWAGYASVWCFK